MIHSLSELISLNLKDGSRAWWVPSYTARTSTPVVVGDMIYFNAFSVGGNEEDVPPQPPFSELAQKYDKDEDGKVSKSEFPNDLYIVSRVGMESLPGASMAVKRFFDNLDKDKDGSLASSEWEEFRSGLQKSLMPRNAVTAVRAGGEGDMTAKAIVWRQELNLPEVPSALAHRGRV